MTDEAQIQMVGPDPRILGVQHSMLPDIDTVEVYLRYSQYPSDSRRPLVCFNSSDQFLPRLFACRLQVSLHGCQSLDLDWLVRLELTLFSQARISSSDHF